MSASQARTLTIKRRRRDQVVPSERQPGESQEQESARARASSVGQTDDHENVRNSARGQGQARNCHQHEPRERRQRAVHRAWATLVATIQMKNRLPTEEWLVIAMDTDGRCRVPG